MRTLLLSAVVVVALAGCSSSSDTSGFSGGGTDSSAPSGSSGAKTSDSSGGGSSASGQGGGGAGILTAGMWDDNLNYDFFGKYRAAHPQLAGDPGFTKAQFDAANAEFAQRAPHTKVDAALVIDTTGSMGDEIHYLTSEFAAISSAIAAKYPGADQRWALVLYRDRPDTDPNDEYVTRTFDFTSDLPVFSSTIAKQGPGDGGDYEEAPELGLEELGQLAWRSDPSVAKLAFWVGDAPHHADKAPVMNQAITHAHARGIHLYPVSASGTDDLLELTMRSAAAITGGRYMFLTDDSGVGDTHKTPEIPCYYVTKLSRGLVRAVSMELSGTYIAPESADVLRTSGDPTADGKCTTTQGDTVQIF